MTAPATAMERLLIGQDRWLGSALKLELRNRRQKFRLGFRARMTVSTNIYRGRTRILLNQFGS